MYSYGIDVSSNNGRVDWANVAATGQSFAWSKATEGLGYVNPNFSYDWANIRANNIIRGAYHYAHPELNSPQNEVNFFLNYVNDIQPGDLFALDLEAGIGDLFSWCLDFLSTLEAKLGFKPFLYSGTWFLEPHNCLDHPELKDFPLWLSGYQANSPAVPDDWNMIALWQFTDKAQVAGIPSEVDQSVFIGTQDDLRKYGMASPQPPQLKPLDVIVNDVSVIGDNTYPDGVDMWNSNAPGQTVCRAVFIRELVQHVKSIAGA